MLNCIKMDLYRMFRMKSFYVLGMILVAATIFTTYMSLLDYRMIQEEMKKNPQEVRQEAVQQKEQVNLGMEVTIPTDPGQKVTVYDEVYANLQGKFIALILVIFAVLFSTADMSSGYVKNIGGQMKNRGTLILSKAVVLFFYTIIAMAFYLAVQTIVQMFCFHELHIGPMRDFLVYTAVQTLLHYALLLICMAVSVIIRNNVFSMTFAILLCMNVLVILYSSVDKVAHKLGFQDFTLIRYTVTGQIALIDVSPTVKACLQASIVAVVLGAAVVLVSSQIFRKRDI